ncbi:MAG: plastocyanin/azurin family copper-binding protein [Bradymonadaceae bacterium]
MYRRALIGSVALALVALGFGCRYEAEPSQQRSQTAQPDPEQEGDEPDLEPKDYEGAGTPEQDEDRPEAPEDKAAVDEEAEETPADAHTVIIEPVDNTMKYQQKRFRVEPGETVHIVFKNTATAEAMKHNVVVLETNTASAAMELAREGWRLPKQEYVPEHEAILAHTALAAPGETVEVTFEAPEEPGKYMYICTFPGHYPTMKGTMLVE